MAEGFWKVTVPVDARLDLVEGKDTLIVSAESSAEAILTAKAYLHLPSDAAWAASTPVLLAHDVDLVGWRLRIHITDPADDSTVEDVYTTATAGDTFDEIGDLAVIALNATTSIGNASYSTPALDIAAIADNIGDMAVAVTFLPPVTWDDPTINFPAMVGAITDEGIAGAALVVVLIDVVAPTVLYQLGSGH